MIEISQVGILGFLCVLFCFYLLYFLLECQAFHVEKRFVIYCSHVYFYLRSIYIYEYINVCKRNRITTVFQCGLCIMYCTTSCIPRLSYCLLGLCIMIAESAGEPDELVEEPNCTELNYCLLGSKLGWAWMNLTKCYSKSIAFHYITLM